MTLMLNNGNERFMWIKKIERHYKNTKSTRYIRKIREAAEPIYDVGLMGWLDQYSITQKA